MPRHASPRLLAKLNRVKKVALIAILPSFLCCMAFNIFAANPPQGAMRVVGGDGPQAIYLDPSTGVLTRLYTNITVFPETCLNIHVGTRVRVTMSEQPLGPNEARPEQLGTRELAMNDMLDAMNRRCLVAGDPDAANLFDSALASQTRRAPPVERSRPAAKPNAPIHGATRSSLSTPSR